MNKNFSDIDKKLIKILGKQFFHDSNFGSKIGEIIYSEIANYLEYPKQGLEKFAISKRTLKEKIGEDEGIIPKIYGRTKVNGRIIWQSEVYTEIDHFKQAEYGKYVNIYCHLAVAICKGPIDYLNKIYINDKHILKGSLNFSFYKGSEEQIQDDFLQSETNNKSPAYRGLSYIVIRDFLLNQYGDNMPNFSFEVTSTQHKLEELKGITLECGSGEDSYNTIIQFKVYGKYVGNKFYPDGEAVSTNCNNEEGVSDIKLSIDQLLHICPNIEYIVIPVNWFASSLDIEDCTIYPAVEYQSGAITSPDNWVVKGIDRKIANRVKTDDKGNLLYGGTPSDEAVKKLAQYLKSLNLKVFINPILLLNIKERPWRGEISGNPEHIRDFFYKKNGYRDFILHYASMMKGKIDGFLIGSEMVGLTKLKQSDYFPAVQEFIQLANDVRKIFNNDEVKITYGANWNEYHGADNDYNMDSLWAADSISFVGINAYFPLTDSAIYNKNFTRQEIYDGWTSGEGYDYYYNEDRDVKHPYDDAKFAWKNIEFWWSNDHKMNNGDTTPWKPKMKKIWFTEFGFLSMNCSTNQPSVEYNKNNTVKYFPYFSDGSIDFYIQRIAIESTLNKWSSSEMVEYLILRSWDPRPYPFFPDFDNIWSDAINWEHSYAINGKIEKIDCSHIVEDLLKYSEINEVEVEESEESICGLTITTMSPKQVIEFLCLCSSIVVFEAQDKIKIGSKYFDLNNFETITSDDILVNKSENQIFTTRFDALEDNCQNINFTYISRNNNYKTRSIKINNDQSNSSISIKVDLVMEDWQANSSANAIVQYGKAIYESYSLSLPIVYSHLKLNDYIGFVYNERDIIFRISQITILEKTIYIEGKKEDESLNKISEFKLWNNQELTTNIQTQKIKTEFEIFETNALPGEEFLNIKIVPTIFSEEEEISIELSVDGGVVFERIGKILQRPCFGTSLIGLEEDIIPMCVDKKSRVNVILHNGELESLTDKEFMENKNLAIIGKEIIQFQNAKKIEEGVYELSNLLRGQYGTENEISNHEQDERFVLLDNAVEKFRLNTNMIDKELIIRLVKDDISSQFSDQKFVLRGLFFNPLSVVNLELYYNRISHEIEVSWKYRARINGELRNYSDVQKDRNFDGYNVEIFNNSEQIADIDTEDEGIVYRIADEIKGEIIVKVFQKSSIFGLGSSKEIMLNI